MQIEFRGKTNKDYCLINTAKFKLKSGTIITVDRDETYFSITKDADGNRNLDMTWNRCYLWDIDDCSPFLDIAYLTDDAVKLFEDAELLELELEDDAPDSDYDVTDVEFAL